MKNDNNYFEKVHYFFLPPQFLVKGFIEGDGAPSCNYEEYLVDLLNASNYFLRRANGEPIKLIAKQDHGEPDVLINGLSLDFKLIGGESAIVSKRHTSHSITNLSSGGVAYGRASGKKDKYEAVRIHLALRKYSCDELARLSWQQKKKDIIENDVFKIINNLIVEKDLLLFLPYAITVEESNDNKTEEIVTRVLEDCFGSLLEYREKMIPDKETFFCCIHNRQMLFYLYKNKRLKLIDSVYTYKSKVFRELANYITFDSVSIEAIIGKDHL